MANVLYCVLEIHGILIRYHISSLNGNYIYICVCVCVCVCVVYVVWT